MAPTRMEAKRKIEYKELRPEIQKHVDLILEARRARVPTKKLAGMAKGLFRAGAKTGKKATPSLVRFVTGGKNGTMKTVRGAVVLTGGAAVFVLAKMAAGAVAPFAAVGAIGWHGHKSRFVRQATLALEREIHSGEHLGTDGNHRIEMLDRFDFAHVDKKGNLVLTGGKTSASMHAFTQTAAGYIAPLRMRMKLRRS